MHKLYKVKYDNGVTKVYNYHIPKHQPYDKQKFKYETKQLIKEELGGLEQKCQFQIINGRY